MSEACIFNPFGLMFDLVLGFWNNEIQRFYTMNIIICGSAKLHIYLTKKKMVASWAKSRHGTVGHCGADM